MSGAPLFLYVLQLAVGPIKVGITNDVKRRLAQLRNTQPFTAVCLHTAPGTYADEAALHRRLAKWSIAGEWFENRREVRDAIDEFFGARLGFLTAIPANLYGQHRTVETGGSQLTFVKLRPRRTRTEAKTGTKTIRKKLADGTVRVYIYDRATGRRLETKAALETVETKRQPERHNKLDQ